MEDDTPTSPPSIFSYGNNNRPNEAAVRPGRPNFIRDPNYIRSLLTHQKAAPTSTSKHRYGFSSFDPSRVKSENSLVDGIFERERREAIDRDIAVDRQDTPFIREISETLSKPSLTAPVKIFSVGQELKLDYIDDGMDTLESNDVEMQELQPNYQFLQLNKGNSEQYPVEYTDENEDSSLDNAQFMKMRYSNQVYAPQHDNLPQGLVHSTPGTDFRPNLTMRGFNTNSNNQNSLLRASPDQKEPIKALGFNGFTPQNYTTQDVTLTAKNNYGAVNPPSAPIKFGNEFGAEVPNPIQSRKKKRQTEKANIINVLEMEGYMGHLSVGEIVKELEPEKAKTKKGGKQQDDKRRKLKEPAKPSGNGDEKGKQRVKSPKQQAVERNVSANKENENQEVTTKKTGTAQPPNGSVIIGNQWGKASAVASSRVSLEDDEFISADEGTVEVSAAPSRYESVAEAPAVTSEVLLDGGNFLADDDDVILQIKKAEEREEEFIPVTKQKKSKESKESNNNKRNGSVSSGSSAQTNSVANVKARSGSGSGHAHHAAPSLADFIEDATKQNKSSHANGGWFTASPKNGKKNKMHDSVFEEMTIITTDSRPPAQFSYADAAKRIGSDSTPSSGQESPNESPQPSQPKEASDEVACTSVKPVPPQPPQKKDSKKGRGAKNSKQEKAAPTSTNENTTSVKDIPEPPKESTAKQHKNVPSTNTVADSDIQSPTSSKQTTQPATESKEEAVTKDVKTPSQATPSALGLSFFYEDNTDNAQKPDVDDNQLQSEGGSLVLRLGDKTINLGQEVGQQQQNFDPRHVQLVELLANQWKRFQNQGKAPNFYTPRIQTN